MSVPTGLLLILAYIFPAFNHWLFFPGTVCFVVPLFRKGDGTVLAIINVPMSPKRFLHFPFISSIKAISRYRGCHTDERTHAGRPHRALNACSPRYSDMHC